MKQGLKVIILLIVFRIIIPFQFHFGSCHGMNPMNNTVDCQIKHPEEWTDKDLVLKIATIEFNRILRVSFNGNEGSDGTLKLYNEANLSIKEASFELIRSPFYASVDISELSPGTYRAELTTKKAVHIATLTIE